MGLGRFSQMSAEQLRNAAMNPASYLSDRPSTAWQAANSSGQKARSSSSLMLGVLSLATYAAILVFLQSFRRQGQRKLHEGVC